jgi:CHAT domain-containing protein
VLNGKALVQQALAEQALLARDTTDPRLKPAIRELLAVRRQLATLTLQSPRPGQEAVHRRKLSDLTADEQRLAKRLAQESGRAEAAWPWLEVDEVRGALPQDTVLIEIVWFPTCDFRAPQSNKHWKAPHYAAWVIPPRGQGDLQLIDLGNAAVIEASVNHLRKALEKTPQRLSAVGEKDAEQQLREPLQRLAKQVLHPLLPHIGQKKRWLISPDGMLWLVPWAALPLPDGQYALEKHHLSYLVSGRDLVLPPPKGRTTRPVVLADPDFDLELTAEGSQRPANEELAFALRSAKLVGPLPRFARLPGTAIEATAITPKLKAYAQSEPVVSTGKDAREEVFKALQRPKVVVLSTHGFFLPDVERTPYDLWSLLGMERLKRKAATTDNPLLRCGLILAGANQRDKGNEGGGEDGILTGLEIVGTDLRGCELVVLSACETGLGQVRNGDGVAGLRQAFQLAGARSVVSSLWQIPDRETAKLMTAFFDHLAKGEAKADALREAQLETMRARRQRDGAAHPFFWAAFTLTGQWQ